MSAKNRNTSKKHITKLFLCAFFFVLCVCYESNAESNEKTQTKQEKCDDNVTVEMGGFLLSVPRLSYIVYKDGKDLYRLYQNRHCDVKHVEDVDGIYTGHFSIYRPGYGLLPDGKVRTTYNLNRIKIEPKKGQKIILNDEGANLIKHKVGYFTIYILPKSLSPTGNGEPVVLRCSGREDDDRVPQVLFGICDVAYIHPSGLRLAYRFPQHGHHGYSESEYISLDQKLRKRLEKLIIKTP